MKVYQVVETTIYKDKELDSKEMTVGIYKNEENAKLIITRLKAVDRAMAKCRKTDPMVKRYIYTIIPRTVVE